MSFDQEYEWMIGRAGPPPSPPSDRDPVIIARTILMGDGKRDEAAAAIAWWCGLTADEAQEAVSTAQRGG